MASGEIASACWIDGSDVATTWMSRMAMNMPRHIRTKPIHVPTLALVVRHTVGATRVVVSSVVKLVR
jgi:hypothetical protein